jgi:hypothetical protein
MTFHGFRHRRALCQTALFFSQTFLTASRISADRERPSSSATASRATRRGHVSVSLEDVIPDDQVIGSLFEDERSARLDRATDGINDRWGRGTVTVAAAMAAKAALDHGRIPSGRPSEYR